MITTRQMFNPVRTKRGRGPARRREPIFRETELGQEQLCDKCLDWWPADPEFFALKGEGLDCRCKACCKRESAPRTEPVPTPATDDQAVWAILYGKLVKPAMST